jgi:hypothetical protein
LLGEESNLNLRSSWARFRAVEQDSEKTSARERSTASRYVAELRRKRSCGFGSVTLEGVIDWVIAGAGEVF